MDSKFLQNERLKTLKGTIGKVKNVLHSRKMTGIGPSPQVDTGTGFSLTSHVAGNSTSLMITPSVDNLSDAILRRIFIFYQPYLQLEHEGTQIPNFQPFFLSPKVYRYSLERICRRWRAIVLDTPILWTTITLDGRTDYTPAGLRRTLSLSKGLLLDIYIRPRLFFLFKTNKVVESLEVLKLERSRIRCLYWGYAHKSELLTLFPIGGNVVTEYPKLEIFSLLQYRSHSTHGLPMGLVYTPRLRHLQLGEAALIQSFMMAISLPLQTLSLTENIFALTSSFYLQFLALCPQLVSLRISIPLSFEIDGTWPRLRFTLPALRRLWFFASFTSNVLLLIRSLDLPALTHLKFGDYNPVEPNCKIPLLWHLLSESAPTLERLSLHSQCMPVGVWIAEPLLFRLVNLQILTLSEFQIHMTMLEPLIPDPNASPERWILPRLKILRFRRTDIEGNLLPNLIQARSFSDDQDQKLRIERSQGATAEEGWYDFRRPREAPHLPDWILRTVEVHSCSFLDDETYKTMLQLSVTHRRVVSLRRLSRKASPWLSLSSL
ncbi:hypothetical protein BU17DRAFT_79558 [Hysterangium stoloniferum]|nr:hypothetical protein BU17DRAFT_79558 [Hysterangium stoloniferum]